MNVNLLFLFLSSAVLLQGCSHRKIHETEVLVLGDGTGAVSAAIGAAREGASVLLVTGLPWLGGMLTSAGVSASDGNHWMPAGLWGEFRDSLRKHYGGADKLSTGWISHTLFEPHIGARIFDQMVTREERLLIWRLAKWSGIKRINEGWEVLIRQGSDEVLFRARILIDGTDLGDVAAEAGANFDVGMDPRDYSGELIAPESRLDLLQDLTYVAILSDFSPDFAPEIQASNGYDRTKFLCACQTLCPDASQQTHPCSTMLNYARLPGNKFMINWPNYGNDYYLNLVPLSFTERELALEKAKRHTLDFVYFIQQELGFKHLGLDTSEFPSADHLPLMPYHREGRRIHGKVRLTLNHILNPYEDTLFRHGIAVGDYPIDHHHGQRPDAPKLDFPPVPSFSIPMDCLIPAGVDQLLVADKAISVSNIVNGASRLQPVVLQIGQVAGIMAAAAVKSATTVHHLEVREIQRRVLEQGGYLAPSFDVTSDDPHFQSIQWAAVYGILKGRGEPFQWANRTWFDPDSTAKLFSLKEVEKVLKQDWKLAAEDNEPVSIDLIVELSAKMGITNVTADLERYLPSRDISQRVITRLELAIICDKIWKLFDQT